MTQRTWEEFEKSLNSSVGPVFAFAEFLHRKGVTIEIPGLKKRGFNGVPNDYKDNGDLFIINPNGERLRIEIKALNTEFTCRADFPYKFLIVANKIPVDRANGEISNWIMISKDRKHFASISKDTRDSWVEKELWAKNSRQYEWFYVTDPDVATWHNMK